MQIMCAEECSGSAFSSHSGGSAGPMRICQRAVRKIIINHMGYMAKIETPAYNVGGDNCFELLFLKSIEK